MIKQVTEMQAKFSSKLKSMQLAKRTFRLSLVRAIYQNVLFSSFFHHSQLLGRAHREEERLKSLKCLMDLLHFAY